MQFSSVSIQNFSFAVLATVAVTTIGQATPAAAANLVLNGSFEQTVPGGTDLKDGGWRTYNSIVGWKATSGNKIEVQRGAAGAAYDGKQLVELDSHNYNVKAPTLGIFQDIKTEIGKTYSLSFFYSARPNIKAEDNVFSVLFGDSLKTTIAAGKGSANTNWMQYTANVIATSNLTRLQFNNEGPRNTFGAYLDAVSLEVKSAEAVPEPTTMAGIGLASLGVAMRKKWATQRDRKQA